MLLHGINDNILTFRPSYFGVYQDEAKNEISTKKRYFWGVRTKPNNNNDKTVVHVSPSIFVLLSPHYIFERGLGVLWKFKKSNIGG